MSKIIRDTSLCAIVRDEIMNPAGGIVDFVECTVPYVEQAVIVDTGSIDGTRQKLEELEKKHTNLTVYDYVFDDYASSRNFSLSKVETKRALVLDADERITDSGFDILKLIANMYPDDYMSFLFISINPEFNLQSGGHNPRLFPVKGVEYRNKESGSLEYLYKDGSCIKSENMNKSGVIINHIVPCGNDLWYKEAHWYEAIVSKGIAKAPSEVLSFQGWKAFNPRRNKITGLRKVPEDELREYAVFDGKWRPREILEVKE